MGLPSSFAELEVDGTNFRGDEIVESLRFGEGVGFAVPIDLAKRSM